MKNHMLKKMLIISIFTLTALFGCKSDTPDEGQVISSYSQFFSSIEFASVDQIVEVRNIDVNGGPIAAVYLKPGTDQLLIVSIGDGVLRTVDLESRDIIKEFDLGITVSTGIGFDRDGELMIAARQQVSMDDGFGERLYIGDMRVWRTSTGEMITFVDRNIYGEYGIALGSDIDSSGERYLNFDELVVGASTISGDHSSISLVGSVGSTYRTISLVEFEEEGKRIATAFDQGYTKVEFGAPYFRIGYTRLGSFEEGSLQPVADLDFSQNGRYLAQITMDTISIWRLGLFRGRLKVETEIPGAEHIEFSSNDDYLIVSTSDEIKVLDVATGEIVSEIEAPGITTFITAEDDRFLIWGDQEGIVHVLGVSISEAVE